MWLLNTEGFLPVRVYGNLDGNFVRKIGSVIFRVRLSCDWYIVEANAMRVRSVGRTLVICEIQYKAACTERCLFSCIIGSAEHEPFPGGGDMYNSSSCECW